MLLPALLACLSVRRPSPSPLTPTLGDWRPKNEINKRNLNCLCSGRARAKVIIWYHNERLHLLLSVCTDLTISQNNRNNGKISDVRGTYNVLVFTKATITRHNAAPESALRRVAEGKLALED